MGTWGLVVRRARAGVALLVTLLVLTAGATAIIGGTFAYSEAAATTSARQALTETVPTEAGMQVQTRLGADPAGQDALARELIDSAFAPVVVNVQRTFVSDPRAVQGQQVQLVAFASAALEPADPRFGELVQLVDGQWPSGTARVGTAVPAALHRGAAEAFGVGVGDTLVVGGTPVLVAATWQPVDAQDPFWFGDPLVETGGNDADKLAGPLVVGQDAIGGFGTVPLVHWTVQPDVDLIHPEDMPGMAQAAAKLKATITGSSVGVRGVVVEGDLAPTAATAGRQLQTARALGLIPIVLLLMVSVISIVQIVRLQAAARSAEGQLFIARGTSGAQLLTWTVLESVVVVVLATALGIGAALAVIHQVPAGDQQDQLIVRTGLLTGAAVLLVTLTVSALQVRALVKHTGIDHSGRTRTVTATGTIVLTLIATVLAWAQLRQYGTPLVTGPDGVQHLDLVAGAAPALVLAAVAVLTMALFGPLGRTLENLTRRTRTATTHLAASQVSRRLVVYVVPVVLTVLAMGATTVAALFSQTSISLRDDLAAVAQGAPIRLKIAYGSASTIPVVPNLTHTPAVTAATPAWQSTTRLGTTQVPVAVLPIRNLATTQTLPTRAFNGPTTTTALATADPNATRGPVIPAAATSLTFPLRVDISAPERFQSDMVSTLVFDERTVRGDMADEGLEPAAIEEALLDNRWSTLSLPVIDSPVVAWIWDPSLMSTRKVALGSVTIGFDTTVDWVLQPPNNPGAVPPPHPEGPFVPAEDLEVVYSAEPVSETFTVALPPGVEGRQLVALTIDFPQYLGQYDATATFDGVTTDDGTNLITTEALADWALTPSASSSNAVYTSGELDTTDSQLRLVVETGRDENLSGPTTLTAAIPLCEPPKVDEEEAEAQQRAAAEGKLVECDIAPVPIAVTEELAAANDLTVGSPVDTSIFGTPLKATVALIVPVIPGSLDHIGLMVDAPTLAAWAQTQRVQFPRPDELWVSTTDPDATVAGLSDVAGIKAVNRGDALSATDTASAVRLVFWVASTGAVLLALTGIAAVATTLLRSRRPEVAVLRALGMSHRSQARSRVAELAGVTALAALVGVIAGLLVGLVIMPDLARSTTLDGNPVLPPQVALEVPVWSALVALMLLAMTVILLGQGLRVRSQALDNEYREEIR